ncbi:MAG: FAD-binding oxidoreductase [bacterium]|nr:FAD-binding oxidoreductase [bacterium]
MGIDTKALQEIMGKDGVISRPDEISGLFARPVDSPRLQAVQPGQAEEIQKLLPWAKENRVSVYTKYFPYFPESVAQAEGVAIDFRRMNQIERVDSLNLMAHVQRGVTFDQLRKVLKPMGLKAVAPVAGGSSSVLESLVNRDVVKSMARYSEVEVTNLKVVLADGRVHLTGSHAMNEEMSDWKEDGGPSFSRWYYAAEDSYGVVCRASINLFPICESRQALAFGFADIQSLITALKKIPVLEIGTEYLGFDRRAFEKTFGVKPEHPWVMIVGFEGRKKHVDWQVKTVKELAGKLGGKAVSPVSEEKMADYLDEPGMPLSPRHFAFYATCQRMPEMDELLTGSLKIASGGKTADLGRILVSFDRGRALYGIYDIFSDGVTPASIVETSRSLWKAGAFFDLPQGKLAEEIYAQNPGLSRLLGRLKGMLDPQGILNPHLPLPKGIPPEKPNPEPLPERKWEEIIKEVREVVGDAWASDRLPDLMSYARDFSIVAGVIPNIVTLPKTTEEIQKIMKIAGKYRVPVIPISTAFNHAGLALPRQGGILLDLRRMNKLRIDPETMTATIEPAIRLRALYMDAIKYEVAEGVGLKPALPLSFTSVSVLANYVARGGAGCMVKYGGNPEMIINMTWVLPDGEIVKLGPGEVPVQYGPGPEIAGMFFNADGQFGVCSEITIKIFPEFAAEKVLSAQATYPEEEKSLQQIIDVVYKLTRENVVDFTYKLHQGVPSTILANLAGVSPDELVEMMPPHSLALLVQAYDQQELEIKWEIVREIVEGRGMFFINPEDFNLQDMVRSDTFKKGYGVLGNRVAAYRGAFQWIASHVKIEKLPDLWREYKELRKKYWSSPDPRVYRDMLLAGMAMQGPMQFGRCGDIEFDWWWDHGNPDSVKRASLFVRKVSEFLADRGAPLFRNMHGTGDIHLPRHKVYFDLLKDWRKVIDPDGIMHPNLHTVL